MTSGGNGTCSLAYLCTAGLGFDGPTGVGTPNGASATGTTPAQSTTTPIVKATLPSVKISRRTVKVSRGGTLKVRISCPFGAACKGHLVLRTTLRGTGGMTLAIGRRGFYVQAGRDSLAARAPHQARPRDARPPPQAARQRRSQSVIDASHSSGAAIFQMRAPWASRKR